MVAFGDPDASTTAYQAGCMSAKSIRPGPNLKANSVNGYESRQNQNYNATYKENLNRRIARSHIRANLVTNLVTTDSPVIDQDSRGRAAILGTVVSHRPA
jgi:hypothetical protein